MPRSSLEFDRGAIILFSDSGVAARCDLGTELAQRNVRPRLGGQECKTISRPRSWGITLLSIHYIVLNVGKIV